MLVGGRNGVEGGLTAELAVFWWQRADAAVDYILGRVRRGGCDFCHVEEQG